MQNAYCIQDSRSTLGIGHFGFVPSSLVARDLSIKGSIAAIQNVEIEVSFV